MDEIRRLKSLLVKHEKRIRALEARAASSTTDINPGSANTSIVADSPPAQPVTNSPQQQLGENHVTHDTNANVAKTNAEEMAPDEV